jgi:Pentapeptide repeats (8 copies)
MPRCWWYPIPNSEVRHRTIVLDAHQKCSETITKAMLTLLAVALFCLLTALGSPDRLLLAADSTIKVPFADAPISFLGFIVVAPLLLGVITVYLHIFYGYWLELERERRQINQNSTKTGEQQIESAPSLFYFTDWVPRLLSSFVFYWLVPLVFAAITWKALGYPPIGRALIYVTGVVTFILIFLQIRRRPGNHRRWWTPLSFLTLALIIVLMFLSIFYSEIFRRPLNLFRAEMPKAWLVGVDMRGANASYANLQQANLNGANLAGANLAGASLQGIKLGYANLQRANLWRAELQGANLQEAHLKEAYLLGANLEKAELQEAHLQEAYLQGANLAGANLAGANLAGASLQGVKLGYANLQRAILWRAELQGANLQEATLWMRAFYDAKMLDLLGLKPNHNEELEKELRRELETIRGRP